MIHQWSQFNILQCWKISNEEKCFSTYTITRVHNLTSPFALVSKITIPIIGRYSSKYWNEHKINCGPVLSPKILCNIKFYMLRGGYTLIIIRNEITNKSFLNRWNKWINKFVNISRVQIECIASRLMAVKNRFQYTHWLK